MVVINTAANSTLPVTGDVTGFFFSLRVRLTGVLGRKAWGETLRKNNTFVDVLAGDLELLARTDPWDGVQSSLGNDSPAEGIFEKAGTPTMVP